MRDQRFVARHRGGPLDLARHRLLAGWAANCAEHALGWASGPDQRVCCAIATARAWAAGKVAAGEACAAAGGAHAAAREARDPATVAAARAAGHAAATAHMAEHALGAAIYALKAAVAVGASPDAERSWQRGRLPAKVRRLVLSALAGERFRRFVLRPAVVAAPARGGDGGRSRSVKARARDSGPSRP